MPPGTIDEVKFSFDGASVNHIEGIDGFRLAEVGKQNQGEVITPYTRSRCYGLFNRVRTVPTTIDYWNKQIAH